MVIFHCFTYSLFIFIIPKNNNQNNIKIRLLSIILCRFSIDVLHSEIGSADIFLDYFILFITNKHPSAKTGGVFI